MWLATGRGNPQALAMATIEVVTRKAGSFDVTVSEGSSQSRHRVSATAEELDRYGGRDDPEALIEASFRFLLEREPKESILAAFELSVIERYFPEYRREIQRR